MAEVSGQKIDRLPDHATFERLDQLLKARDLTAIVERLGANQDVSPEHLTQLDDLLDAHKLIENEFHNQELEPPRLKFAETVEQLHRFIFRQFFLWPGQASGWRFLQPEVMLDGKRGDQGAMRQFWDLEKELNQLCAEVEKAYEDWRRGIKATLLV